MATIRMMTLKSPLVSLISASLSSIFIFIIIINLTHLSFGQLEPANKTQQVDDRPAARLSSVESTIVDAALDTRANPSGASGATTETNDHHEDSNLLQYSKQQVAAQLSSSDQVGQLRALGDERFAFGDHSHQPIDGADKGLSANVSNAFEVLFKKKPYSKYWSVEQKWDDLFKRFIAVEGPLRQMMLRNLLKDIEYYADITISRQCGKDLKFIQNYVARSKNMRWLAHMLDATGKNEPGMLTGNLAHLGHPVQCIRVRAPARPSNDTFDERFFQQQTRTLGERFRGKYCLASIRPVLPPKPRLISRFEPILNASMLSNISYTGEPLETLKRRSRQFGLPSQAVLDSIDRHHLRLDQVPFESELYQYLIAQRNFMFSLPRFLGVCYPSSCSREDIRASLQKTFDDQHQVVDIEFECEQEEDESSWGWFSTPRLLAYIVLFLFVGATFGASIVRHILVDKMQIKRSKLKPTNTLYNLLGVLEMLSLDKCVGILFIKTKRATPFTDWTRLENNRSNCIDALKGFLVLVLLYSQLALLGCLPVAFMWSKWADAMFPFFRAPQTQFFLNALIWSEAFYIISAYLIGLKFLENCRPKVGSPANISPATRPNFVSFAMKRYIRLLMPMLAFILMNYVWPRLSNGFVMQDQANKLLAPCDNFGWTNVLMFHNYYGLNETCLWPSHVGASFFQLHLISYPILLIFLNSLRANLNTAYEKQQFHLKSKLIKWLLAIIMTLFISFGIVYPALVAKNQELVVPFLIDYLDFDNYQRVIEWMVMPTYNHLTSYLVGLTLAYLVIKKRADLELAQVSSNDCLGYYIHREGSFDSIRSSSTQELQKSGFHLKEPIDVGSGGKLNLFMPTIYNSNTRDDLRPLPSMQQLDQNNWICESIKSSLALILLLLTLVTSWYWNGLGEPISGEQTFWYLCSTKLVFSLTFAYLFYRHFAIRKNSTNPWMITRFLVPIGRMGLMVFYVSWLVIWFDLLASPYQWHPSHYFIGEKFNEIAFTTLVLSLFAYGTFEGTIKRVQYITRLNRVEASLKRQAAARLPSLDGSGTVGWQQAHHIQSKVKSFELFFHPSEMEKSWPNDGTETNNKLTAPPTIDGQPVQGSEKQFGMDSQRQQPTISDGPTVVVSSSPGGQQVSLTTGDSLAPASMGRRLSAADQCKLNAELRANYSFASIGLYESAGATGDLS